MSKSHICMMTFPDRTSAENALAYLTRERYWCLPMEEAKGHAFLAFIIGERELPAPLRHILNEFCATDIEIEPLNARMDYQNYCHTLFFNDYQMLGQEPRHKCTGLELYGNHSVRH